MRPDKIPGENIYDVRTHASGPPGRLPLDPDILSNAPSGHVFGWTQDAAIGWNPYNLGKDEYLILSTQGNLLLANAERRTWNRHLRQRSSREVDRTCLTRIFAMRDQPSR